MNQILLSYQDLETLQIHTYIIFYHNDLVLLQINSQVKSGKREVQ
jgi:hypothetical protein